MHKEVAKTNHEGNTWELIHLIEYTVFLMSKY